MLQRAALINQLHATRRPGDLRGVPELIADDVLALDASARLLMPGGWFRHAVVYEFKREGDALLFSIYNSGRGSEHHEQRSSKTQLLICPIKTYCIPDMYAALSLEATKPRFIQALILPQLDSYSSYATRMYTEVFPEIAQS